MKKHNSLITVSGIATACFWMASGVANGSVIYYEDFTGVDPSETIQGSGTYNAASSTGWDLYGTQGAGVSADNDWLWDFKNLNDGGAIVNEAQPPISTGLNQLTFTAELRKDLAAYEEAVLMVEIDNSQWYAWDRDDAITATTGGGTWDTITWAFDATASNWQKVALAYETEPVKGAFETVDLSGQITGFGLYHDRESFRGNNSIHLNKFTITAVIPEPSTLALLGSGLALMLGVRRRKSLK